MTQAEIVDRIRGIALNLQNRAVEGEAMSASMVSQQCLEIFDLCDQIAALKKDSYDQITGPKKDSK